MQVKASIIDSHLKETQCAALYCEELPFKQKLPLGDITGVLHYIFMVIQVYFLITKKFASW